MAAILNEVKDVDQDIDQFDASEGQEYAAKAVEQEISA